MVLQKKQLTFLFVGILAIAIIYGCGSDSDDGSGGTAASTPDLGPRVTIEEFFGDEAEEARVEEEGRRFTENEWFQVRVKAKPAPKDQDLIVRVRLLFTELNISEEQVMDLKDEAFDQILWFRIRKLEETSEPIPIRSNITTALQVVELRRRHKFESDTIAADGSTIPEWWEASPYQIADPSVLIRHYE